MLAGSYLDLDGFDTRTIAPSSLVRGDHIDPSGEFDTPAKVERRAKWIAFIEAKLVSETSWINAQLRKRYDAPFVAPYPEAALGWLAVLVTPFVYRKRGIDPSDEQIVSAEADAQRARDDIAKAADSETGLFELPIRQDVQTSAVTQGGPLSYSEADCYIWTDVQREALQ